MTSSRLDATLAAARGAAEPAAADWHPQDDVIILFDAYSPNLVRYVRSLGLDNHAAQDIVQEVFLALFHHIRLERPRTNLKGWLFQVAHNLALKHRRKVSRQPGFVADAALAELLVDPAANPEQQLATGQRRARLLAVVHAMPERDRQCLHLRAEGLRYREIAGVLGISLGSVAKSLARAVARLTNVEKD